MVGSSDFEKGLYHFGGEDGGDHLPSNWGMDEEPDEVYFSTYDEAKKWAMSNVGQAFTRSPDGSGFVPKVKERYRK